MALKLALSNYLEFINYQRYRAVCFVVDCWFHVHRGYKDPTIDYISLGLFARKLVIENIGMKTYEKKKKKRKSRNDGDGDDGDQNMQQNDNGNGDGDGDQNMQQNDNGNGDGDGDQNMQQNDNGNGDGDGDQNMQQNDNDDGDGNGDEDGDAESKISYALKLIRPTISFKATGLFTRFTGHNAFWHLFTDMDNWGNLNIANCKQLEKTNKNTKEALRKGTIGSKYCNRIMKYYKELLIGTYLLEGNAINDDGYFDPFNGKHFINDSLLCKLSDMTWMSFFWDMKHNDLKPEYNDGHQLEKIVKIDEISTYFLEMMKNADDFADIPIKVFCNDNGNIMEVKWYWRLKYWRKYKAHQIQRGTLVSRKKPKHCSQGRRRPIPVELCLVLGLGTVHYRKESTRDFIVGHKVVIQRTYPRNGDRNLRAQIKKDLVCWEINQIDYNVRYSHICNKNCSFTNSTKKHDWNQDEIALFWFVGVGRGLFLGDPLTSFEGKHFQWKTR